MLLTLLVSIVLGSKGLAAPPTKDPVVQVSKGFLRCIDIAHEVQSGRASSVDQDGNLFLSDRDSAFAGCFFKFSELEKLSFRRCFEVASTLPTRFARGVATQSCFNTWSEQGSLSNCSWAADQVGKYGGFKAHASTLASDAHTIFTYASVAARPVAGLALAVPDYVGSREYLRAVCNASNETVFAPRMTTQREAARLAIAAKIKGSDIEPPIPEITREIPDRPFAEAEKQVCGLDAAVLAAQYEILRSRRAEELSRLLTLLLAALEGVPRNARNAISMGTPEKAEIFLESYGRRFPAKGFLSLDAKRHVIQFGYNVAGSYGDYFNGEIEISESLAQDRSHVFALTEPVEGGWPAYHEQNGSAGCPFAPMVPQSTPGVAIRLNASKKSLEQIEQRLGSCNPIQTDCGAAGAAR